MSPDHDPARTASLLTGFAAVLRRSGMNIGLTQMEALQATVIALGGWAVRSVYWAGRATLCASQEDLSIFDRCFEQFFGARSEASAPLDRPDAPRFGTFFAAHTENASHAEQQDDTQVLALASADEVLRRREFSTLSPVERAEILAQIARMQPQLPQRRSRRKHDAKSGGIDVRQTIRSTFACGGDTIVPRYRKPRQRARKCVFLIDISGSMKPYADPLLHFAFAAQRLSPRSTQVFTVGTRLTALTQAWRDVVPEQALQRAGKAIPDWHGGTRLGEQLKRFLDLWGQRGMVRGAVAVIASDGWEHGDATLLGEQMQRLGRLAHRVIWCNPHKSGPGYEPLARGMQAALPHVDDFLSGCTLSELDQLAAAIASVRPSSAQSRR